MKIIKSINNNVTVCVDNDNNEVVTFGKGIGYNKQVNDEIELSKIERTYYKVNAQQLEMIKHVSEESIDLAVLIVDYYIKNSSIFINPNTVFTLADHIDFSIKRFNQGIEVSLPILNDIEHLYINQYKAGVFALNLINEKLGMHLPNEEAGLIALHLINAEIPQKEDNRIDYSSVMEDVIQTIESFFDIKVDRNGTNYSRFVSHMNYLFIRGGERNFLESSNAEIYSTLVEKYSNTHRVVEKIVIILEDLLKYPLTNEEKLYLILHVNRLCIRDDFITYV